MADAKRAANRVIQEDGESIESLKRPSSKISGPSDQQRQILLDRHRSAMEHCLRPWPSPSAHRWSRLRRQRIALEAELAVHKECQSRTVGEILLERKRLMDQCRDRPYLLPLADGHGLLQADETAKSAEDPLEEEVVARDLSSRMQSVRQCRQLSAAYRLAGVTLQPLEDEVLAIRLDVSVEGDYVGCYHVFFQLVVAQGEEDLYVRLLSHTCPASVDVNGIIEKQTNGYVHIGRLSNESQWKVDNLKDQLRSCTNQLYHACYCYELRRHSVQLLQSLDRSSAKQARRIFIVEEVESNASYECITFQLKILSGAATLLVELAYKDRLRQQPTSVSVKRMSAAPRSRYSLGTVSDDDESAGDDLLDTATVAFRRRPLGAALDEVARAMAEW